MDRVIASNQLSLLRMSLLGLLISYLLLPGLRPIFKYSAYPVVSSVTYLILASGLLFLLLNKKLEGLQKVIASPLAITFFLACISIACWIIYPYADSLKLSMRGSDQDDCIILGVNSVLNFSHPYSEKTYFGNPCSPGHGILILYTPFVLFHTYILGAIAAIAVVSISIHHQWKSWSPAGLWLLALFSCLAIPELLAVGSDLILLGCGITLVAMFLPSIIKHNNIAGIFGLGLLSGLLASSRINFIVLAPLLSLFVFAQWKRGGLLFFCISMLMTFIPAIYIYFLDPANFTPFHLAGKSTNIAGPVVLLLGALLCTCAAIYSTLKISANVGFIPMGIFIALAPMLLSISIGDLATRQWNISAWDGANYLIPLAPLAAYLLVRLNAEKDRSL
jgi:hypothetical protein